MTLHINGDLKYECNEAIEKIIDKAYKRGYEDGQKIHEEVRNKDMDYGYEKGLEDAWECARMIDGYDMNTVEIIFGKGNCVIGDVLRNYSVQEAMQKIKEFCVTDEEMKRYRDIVEKYRPKEERQNIKERKCETCDLFLKDCIGAVMLDGCSFYKQKQKESK